MPRPVAARRVGPLVAATAMLLGLVAAVPVPASAAPGPVVDVPASIDATGGTDVTAALDAFLATLPVGATARFASGGRYRVDGVLFLPGRQDVTLDGRGARIVAPTDGAGATPPRANFRPKWPRSREHLEIVDSRNVTIRDLTIDGPNAAGEYRAVLEAQAGIAVKRSQGVTLDHVTIAHTYGDGVYVTGASAGIRVQDCTLDHNGRQAVAVVAGTDVTVRNCTIRAPGRSALDLEPGFGPASQVHFEDNEVSDAGNLFVAAVGGGNGVGDVWIQRNRVSGGKGLTIVAGVNRFVRTGFHVIDNTGTGTSGGYSGTLMSFVRFDGVEVRGNRQTVGSGVVPVSFTNSCNTTVTGNSFGSDAAEPRSTGDCTAPGLAPARRVPIPTTRPTGTGPNGGANPGSRPVRPYPPSTTVARPASTPSDTGAWALLAFGAGVLVGAGGLWLVQRARRRNPAVSGSVDGEDPGTGAQSEGT